MPTSLVRLLPALLARSSTSSTFAGLVLAALPVGLVGLAALPVGLVGFRLGVALPTDELLVGAATPVRCSLLPSTRPPSLLGWL